MIQIHIISYFRASNTDNLLWTNRLLTFQWQHEKNLGFLVLVLSIGLDSILPFISKIKNTNAL